MTQIRIAAPIAATGPAALRALSAAAMPIAVAGGPFASRADAAAPVGAAAPSIGLVDTAGRTVSLDDFRGRHVVLERVNPGCPFVQKHHGAGNMRRLQARYGAKGVAWLAVDSTNPSHRDCLAPAARNRVAAAVDEALAGRPVSVAISAPYGCPVEY
ncbi:MAG: redoxin family protein [Lautropia sp.]